MVKRISSTAVQNGGAGKKKKKGMPRMPKKVLEDAEAAGAVRERCPGEDFSILRMSFEDDAYNIVNEWISGLDGDPGVLAIFAPSANIIGTANGLQILNEANSIVNHYAPFTEATFDGNPNPAIPGPIAAPQMPVNVHHAKIALHALHQRIQNPQDQNYPNLSALPSGSYICNVLIQWAHVAQTTALYKP